jgi:hypothetical protein
MWAIKTKKNKKIPILFLSILFFSLWTMLVACKAPINEDGANGSALNEEQGNLSAPEITNDPDEMMALSLAERFCADMTASWLNLERVDMSDYLVDNLDTHLVLNWIDFEIADKLQNTWKQLISIDNIKISGNKFAKSSEREAIYEAFVEISYTRYDPSVIGIGINLTLGLEKIDGTWMITSADTIAASVYNEWKEGNYSTIAEMDASFVKSCAERGISVANHSKNQSKHAQAILKTGFFYNLLYIHRA